MKSLKEWIAIIAAILACLLVVWRGGQSDNVIRQTAEGLAALAVRVAALEKGVTAGADKHISTDEERDRIAAQNISNMQKQISDLLELKAKVLEMAAQSKGSSDLISFKLDALTKSMEKHLDDKKP